MSENSPEPFADQEDASLDTDAGADGTAVAQAIAHNTDEGNQERPPAGADDLCRLNICGPSTSVELAVPVHVPLIDLLPAMIGHLGENLAEAGLEHGGWVLQRLGDLPLGEELSVAALGLHDGDTVHLRPRAEQLPPLDFDDLIDGIAVGISGRPDRWRPETSRRVVTGLLAVPLAAGLAVLAAHAGTLAGVLAAVAAVTFLVLCATASRVFADMPAAHILSAAAIAYAAAAGAELALAPSLTGHTAVPHLGGDILRPALLAAVGAAAVMSAAATVAIGGRKPALVGITVAAIWATVAAALATGFGLSAPSAAGVALAPLLPFSGWIPVLSFRLAGLRMDPLPTTPDELQANLDPVPGQHLMDRTRLADRYQTALYWGLAVIAAGCLVPLGVARQLSAHLVALDAVVAMLLHARILVSARQRLAVILPAAGGLGVLSVAAGLGLHNAGAWAVVFACLVAAGCMLFAAERTLPGRTMVPHWGWAGDILQSLTALALIPLVLWLLYLYQYAREVHL